MNSLLFKIRTIAFYEIKTLLRSWFFRIFTPLAIVILVLLNIFFFPLPDTAIWTLRGIPSSIPYMNMMLLNVLQAVIGIFLASDFLKFDTKFNSTDVIYVRSMTNFEYVIGKTIGIFSVFFSLNMVTLAIALTVNIFFVDVPVSAASYFYYPLFISLPTLAYIIGLTFLSMTVLGSQAITFILLLGYVVSTLIVLGSNFHNVFDYMAFYVPLMYSDITGFGDIIPVILQRSMYLSAGLGFILITVLRIKRLPQSRMTNKISLVLSIVLVANALILGQAYLRETGGGSKLRAEMNMLNETYAEKPNLTVTNMQLDIVHDKDTIAVTAEISVVNKTSFDIDSYVFSLNPGLSVQEIQRVDTLLTFESDRHILIVNPGSNLMPGESDRITVNYQGTIDEAACYTDIPKETRAELYRLFLYNIDKRYAFVTPEYVLLTVETLWYPVAGVPFGSAFPKPQRRDFIDFSLRVKTDASLTALSQGHRTADPANGVYRFEPEYPLPQISLVIGDYEEKSITAGGIDYSIHFIRGHDYFSNYFTDITEKLPEVITEYKQDYERTLRLSYPYKRFSFVETPIQFYAYDRLWTFGQETVQPEQILLPEKGVLFMAADFRRNLYYLSRFNDMQRSPEDIQITLLKRFLEETVIGDSYIRSISRSMRSNTGEIPVAVRPLLSTLLPSTVPSYNMFPNYYGYTNYVYSEEWPVFNISLEKYLNSGIGKTTFFNSFSGLTNVETANIELSKHAFTDIFSDPGKTYLAYDVLNNKADYLFALIKSEVGDKPFEDFLYEILLESRFTAMDVQTFLDHLNDRFGFDLKPHLDTWMNERIVPSFLFTDVNCTEFLDGEATRYNVTFEVYNPETVDGVFSAGFNTLVLNRDRIERNPALAVPIEPMEFYYTVTGNQTKEIGIVLDFSPRTIQFNTFISQNLPTIFERPLPKPVFDEDAPGFEGERIFAGPPALSEPGVIIVDNEDHGFEVHAEDSERMIIKMLNNQSNSPEDEYIGFRFWMPPDTWRAAVQNEFYGVFKHTAYYTQAGSGDNSVSWQAEITQSGKYDIYYSTPPFVQIKDSRIRVRGERGNRSVPILADHHFRIYHDDGIDETVLDIGETTEEWTYLGTYYLSKGVAKIELTNESKGRVVYADAVKWSLNR
ncbi:hypothetical protein ACFL6H_06060 [Candidatus Latescibacterota bacterium]